MQVRAAWQGGVERGLWDKSDEEVTVAGLQIKNGNAHNPSRQGVRGIALGWHVGKRREPHTLTVFPAGGSTTFSVPALVVVG